MEARRKCVHPWRRVRRPLLWPLEVGRACARCAYHVFCMVFRSAAHMVSLGYMYPSARQHTTSHMKAQDSV